MSEMIVSFFIGKSSKLILRKQYLENVCIFTSGSVLNMSVQNRLFFSDQIKKKISFSNHFIFTFYMKFNSNWYHIFILLAK